MVFLNSYNINYKKLFFFDEFVYKNIKKYLSVSMIKKDFYFAVVDKFELKIHERVNKKHLKELKRQIAFDKYLKKPIVADSSTKIILDGHHRFLSLIKLGYEKIPVIFIDYSLPRIIVKSWRRRVKVTKEMVINAGLSRKKLLPKTSRHMIRIKGKLKNISAIELRMNIPLDRLKLLSTCIKS